MTSALARLGYPLWRLTLGNPILLSVVSQSSRRTAQTWLRTGYLAALLMTALIMLAKAQTSAGVTMSLLGQAGERMFTLIALLQLTLICALSPVFAAGAISQQGDSRTLPVLLATPMSSGQIVLGSLLSRVFLIWALLAAGLPIMAVTRLFGKVSNAQIFEAAGIAAATALLTGAIAVAWSARSVGRRSNLLVFYLGVFGYLVLLPLAGAMLPACQLPAALHSGNVNWLTPIHPISLLTVLRGLPEAMTFGGDATSWQPPAAEDVRRFGYGAPWDWYLSRPAEAYMTISSVLSLLLIIPAIIRLRSEASLGPGPAGQSRWTVAAVAALRLPGVWLAARVVRLFSAERAAVLDRRTADLTAELSGKPVRRTRTVWHNPIAWREAVTAAGAGGRGAAKWVFVAAGLIVAVVLAGRRLATPDSGNGPDNIRLAVGVAITIEFFMILAVVLNAGSAAIARERESETLDLLLTTPMTPRYYIWGKLRGLVSFVLPMIAVPAATIGILWVADLINAARTGRYVPTVMPEAAVELPVLMTAFCAAAAVIALRMSLISRRTAGAVFKSVLTTVAALAVAMGIGGAIRKAAAGSPGAGISGLSPVDAVINLAAPWDRFPESMDKPESSAGRHRIGAEFSLRALLMFMTILISLAYAAAIYGAYGSLASNWQATIRRQQS